MSAPVCQILYCATLLFKVLYCKISNVFLPTSWLVGLVTKSCPTLADPMDCSLPGSSVHGTLQARILEWVAISSLYSTGNSDQCYVAAWMGKEVEEEWIHVYIRLSLFAVYLKLSQHCQLPILQYKIAFKNNNMEKQMAAHSSILAWKVHGQRSLAGCSPWGYMTEHVCTRVEGGGLVAINW